MAISVTIADGQVFVCVCVPSDGGLDDVSGPFTDRRAAREHLHDIDLANPEALAEADRLCELGVPFFIAAVGEHPAQAQAHVANVGSDLRHHL